MSRAKKPDFSEYEIAGRVSLQQDMVRFALWAKEKHPGIFVSYREVCQRINGYQRLPGPKDKQVEAVRRATSRVRRLLIEQHGCTLITDPVLGMRASVNSAEVLEDPLVRAAGRLRSAQEMFRLTADLVDTKEVPNTPEYKPLKEWYSASVIPVVKSITTTDFAKKLLPPKREEPK